MTSPSSSIGDGRIGVDRNAFALALISALVAGGCLGAMTADFGARATDFGYEPAVFADSISAALFIGAALNGMVSLVAFVSSRAAAFFSVVLAIGAVSAAPVANGIASLAAPVIWEVECSHGNGRACHAVGRREAGIAADVKACDTGFTERPCERLLERDSEHADVHCARWRAACGATHRSYGKCSVLESGRCRGQRAAAPDSVIDF